MGLQQTPFPSTTAGTANAKSITFIPTGNYATLWVKATGFNTTDATVVLEGSNKDSSTDSDWVELPESDITIEANGTAYVTGIVGCGYGFVRAKFEKGTNSAGTFEAIINFNI